MADSKNVKTPILRIAKRKERSKKEIFMLQVWSFLFAIVAGGLFILILGHNPIEAYAEIIKGAFKGSKRDSLAGIRQTVILFVPLLLTALGLSLAYKTKFWNIGGEGQILMGAIFASYFALYNTDNPVKIPKPLVLLIMFLAGALGGGIMALIPAIFKTRFGTNETLFTLMLNYIALYFLNYLLSGPWQRTPGFASIGLFHESTDLWEINGFHLGILFAVLMIFAVHIYMKKTKSGYEMSVVGESQPTARYAGMSVKKIILRTMFLSGAICGIVGMINVSVNHTITDGITGGVGFSAITIAWLANFNAFAMALIAALFSILSKGSMVMQTAIGISSFAADVLQGIILFSFLGFSFFSTYRLQFKGIERKEI